MKILATADFHGSAEAFRKTALKARQNQANVVVVCGDITHFGSVQQAQQLLFHLRDVQASVFFVPGNCDAPGLAGERTETAECIHGKCKRVDGVNFLGVGGSSPSPFNTPFELTEIEIARVLEQGFNDCHTGSKTVLVTHSPPRNTKVDLTFTAEHVGSSSVRSFIENTKPVLTICGHIHEASGIDRIDNSIIVNPGPAAHGYLALIDLNETASVEIGRM